MTAGLLISSAGGILLGVEASRRQGSLFDRAVTALASVSDAIPSFCLGQVALIIFALWLNLFPAQGMISARREMSGAELWMDVLSHFGLPALTLAWVQMALLFGLRREQHTQLARIAFQ